MLIEGYIWNRNTMLYNEKENKQKNKKNIYSVLLKEWEEVKPY